MKKNRIILFFASLFMFLSCTKKEVRDGAYYNKLFWEAYKANDHVKQYEYAKKSAELGDPDGQYWMGWFSERDDTASSEEIIDWYTKSAMQGQTSSMKRLGYLYMTAWGDITHEYETARRWYEMARSSNDADRGIQEALEILPEYGDYKGMYALALSEPPFYDMGDVCRRDFRLAVVYAIKGGFADGSETEVVLDGLKEYIPATFMEEGKESYTNYALKELADMAFDEFTRSATWPRRNINFTDYISVCLEGAENGFAAIQYLAGCLYENGTGVEQSYEKAEHYYTLAESQGFSFRAH